MRIDVKDDVSDEVTFQSMFEEHFSELNENIFTDAKNFLSNIKDKIQDFIKKAAAHIYNLGKRGIMAILRFLGITPTSISVSNAIIEETLTSLPSYSMTLSDCHKAQTKSLACMSRTRSQAMS